MELFHLLSNVAIAQRTGHQTDMAIDGLWIDSRKVEANGMFFAVRGAQSDGHDYIAAAIERGASAIVCETLPTDINPQVAYIQVDDTNIAIGRIAANFYDHPSRKLALVGVTGTNGKTTTATLLYDLFRALCYKAGLISTVVYRVHDRSFDAPNTTPDAITLNRLMAQMVEAGCDYCFMEVSSHAVVQHRIESLHFTGGLFTNITHDHLDYHGTFAEYIRAKKSFFDELPKEAFALINGDDRNAGVMVQNTKAKVKKFALQSGADYRCRIVETHFEGMLLEIDGVQLWVRFLGRFNAYNLLGVYATALLLGAEKEEVLQRLSSLEAPSGRLEFIRSPQGITAIVDYAHTPDALENVMRTIDEIRTPEQKLIVVVGCGGNRDASKRPVMARIAAEGGDMAILTSDNPRREEPEAILHDMEAGLAPGTRHLKITDRREAIKTAVALCRPGDIMLVAGKGHENYQEIDGVKHHFDDKEEITAAFGLA